jgi:hypothetical protein
MPTPILYDWSTLVAHIYNRGSGHSGDYIPAGDWTDPDYDDSGAAWNLDAVWRQTGTSYFPLDISDDPSLSGSFPVAFSAGGYILQNRCALNFPSGSEAYGRIRIPDQIRSAAIDTFVDEGVDLYVNGTLVYQQNSARVVTEGIAVSDATWANRASNGDTVIAFYWNNGSGEADLDMRIVDVTLVGDVGWVVGAVAMA